jgi:RHS repeat-associated protein
MSNQGREDSAREQPFQKGQSEPEKSIFTAPSISLPKGGGAIRGMGEKFAANPVTGTGSMSVPIAVSPGRSGFSPQLSLSYDSGSGNGPFGLGWNLSLPSITRKTDKGLPRYHDDKESDVFILSGAEDLVPVLRENGEIDEGERAGFLIRRYRPRIEGLFAQIERWTRLSDGDTHWRSISKENILTIYGKDLYTRIADPQDNRRVFSWLICETRDDKGNGIVYEYIAENATEVDLTQANERNRGDIDSPLRTANYYLKHIRYGNKTSLLDGNGKRPSFLTDDLRDEDKWMFHVVFDYGDEYYAESRESAENHGFVEASLDASKLKPWPVRPDPLSTYRPGFEVRTYRLCQRVLMFHHFQEVLGAKDYLVRSTEFQYKESPIASFIASVTQSGYVRRNNDTYLKRSLPPLEFKYSEAVIQNKIHEVDPISLQNLPYGLDGGHYQWVDLDGEGISGILTEQAESWFYKPNIGGGRFGPVQQVVSIPSLANLNGGQQLMDLAGDGQLDLVQFAPPLSGFYERTQVNGWSDFSPFTSIPNVDWRDPNLKFIDLTGDGHADILISEDEVFTWYPSMAEAGFGRAERVRQALDEEDGPRLVFADSTQSIFLADFSGDGLTDLVRIRNGEVCYWPNLGYGRFGAKVTMDDSPWFDRHDQFDQRRIRLADIDGSGMTDIIYLHGDGIRLYFNQSGNSWEAARELKVFPPTDNITSVTVVDLLGNGTACLVWSSTLLGHALHPMRYVDLMGGQKPHLLVKTVNNLGAETEINYASSTKFYLADKLAGKPWITRLSFPVHCVEKLTVRDKWRQTAFSSTYSYHHGYFDGAEREFRGFGRVEQVDVERFGKFASGNSSSPYITDDKTLYQPPVKTVTWFHTGAFLDRKRILSQFTHEYFPNWFEDQKPGEVNVLGTFLENELPEPDLIEEELTADEWREALRACKGMLLRQEVYELDVDALEDNKQVPVKLFSTAYHNCHIRRLQARESNRYAVFHVRESEAINYHYELDLRQESLQPDPRITHTLNLNIDQFGNVLQSVALVYPRVGRHQDSTLPAGAEGLIADVQKESHLSYTENRYTGDFRDDDNYRMRIACEVLTYELTGISPEGEFYFSIDELRGYRLSEVHQKDGTTVTDIPYHRFPNRTTPEKRIVEHTRMLFFHQNLQVPLDFGILNHLGLQYETYKLALTEDLLNAIFSSRRLTPEVQGNLTNQEVSGYLGGSNLTSLFGNVAATDQFWIRSGIPGFESDAAKHFYLPERYTDPFGNTTILKYDKDDLFIQSSTDPVGNRTEVVEFHYRVLAPSKLKDINDNLSEVVFDILGMPTAMAVEGKGTEADNLVGLDDASLNPIIGKLIDFFVEDDYTNAQAQEFLGNATVRHLYYFGETVEAGKVVWGKHPACACAILREKHVAQLESGEESSLQAAFEYSDGMGTVLVKKAQAEPEPGQSGLRWIASGKTILNNKGKPVKQYEPYFSENGHRFDDLREVGVTPVMYYDAVGRLIRTEMPDRSYSRVEFSPWQVKNFDQNDTLLEPGNRWGEEKLVSEKTLIHADTPAETFLDSLGREVIALAHNKYRDRSGVLSEEKHLTFTKLDAEGKPLWIRDARGNLVMQYITPFKPTRAVDEPDQTRIEEPPAKSVPCYDIAGNLLFQHSMDAGNRWTLNDAAGKPMYSWDFNERRDESGVAIGEDRIFYTRYDQLHRPTEHLLTINGSRAQLIELSVYGEGIGSPGDDQARNLRGQLYQHYDTSGLKTVERYDFKGNALEARRQLATDYKAPVIDWRSVNLEPEIFVQITEYDALNRMTRLYHWHRGIGARVAVYEPRYNKRGLLNNGQLIVRASKTSDKYTLGADSQRVNAIEEVTYDAKGQRQSIRYGNGTTTRYQYDRETFRLIQLRTTRPGFYPDFPIGIGLKDQRILQNLYYTYDPVGNITEIYDDAYEPAIFSNQQVEPRNIYAYDALYRLISATGRENFLSNAMPGQFETPPFVKQFPINDSKALRNYSEFYTYDSVGNFLEMKHEANGGSWTRQYEYFADSNRLKSDRSASNPADAVQYRYDTHGSMLNLANVAPEHFIRWDYQDMIHTFNLEGGGLVSYNYASDKERSRKVNEMHGGAKQWERIYLGSVDIYRRYGISGVVEEIETIHLMHGNQRVLLIEDVLQPNNLSFGSGQLYRYQYSNQLNSASLELNDQAQIISYEEYYAYGSTSYQAVAQGIKAAAKRYRYTGQERDDESGLYYHEARYYAPWLGRWVSIDPAGFADGPNLFQYVQSNPVNISDLTGMEGVRVESKPHEEEEKHGTPYGVIGKAFEVAAHLSHHNLEASVRLAKAIPKVLPSATGAAQRILHNAEYFAKIAGIASSLLRVAGATLTAVHQFKVEKSRTTGGRLSSAAMAAELDYMVASAIPVAAAADAILGEVLPGEVGQEYKRTLSFEKNISGTAHTFSYFTEAAVTGHISIRQQQDAYISYVIGEQGGLLELAGIVAESSWGKKMSGSIAELAFNIRNIVTRQEDFKGSRDDYARLIHRVGELNRTARQQAYTPKVTQLHMPRIIKISKPFVIHGTIHHGGTRHTPGAPKRIVPPL